MHKKGKAMKRRSNELRRRKKQETGTTMSSKVIEQGK